MKDNSFSVRHTLAKRRRSVAGGFQPFQVSGSLEARALPLSGTGKRLVGLILPPQHSAKPREARLQHFLCTGASQEAFLQSLQRIVKSLEVTSSSATAPQSSGRRASSFSSTPRSSWRSPPAPPASREASGGDLQLLQSTEISREARLQSLPDHLQGPKNRLQPLRSHLQELEAHLQELEASPKGVRTILGAARGTSGTAFHPLHETTFLGLR